MSDVQSFEEILKQLESLKQLPEKLPDIGELLFSVNDTIFDDIATLVTTVYPKTEWDEEFVSGIKSNRSFIEQGLKILDGNESVCPFCKQPIGDAAILLIRKYKAFLADKEAEVLRKIESNIAAINGIIDRIKQYAQATKNANVEIENLKKYFPSLEKTELIIPQNNGNDFDCFDSVITSLNTKSENVSCAETSINVAISECRNVIKALLQRQKSNSAIIKSVNKTKQDSNYNVPMNSDKVFEDLSEPDIIKDRKLSERRFTKKWEEENFQPNSKQILYWSCLEKKNRSAN